MRQEDGEPPFDHGSQDTPEHPTPPPGEGRSVIQIIVIGIGILVVVAGLLWLLVPVLGG